MPSPAGYFDDDRCDLDPPPRGSARLVGDMSRLAGVRAVADVRESPGPPLTPRQRRTRRRHLMVLICRVNGMTVPAIADATDLTPRQIFTICRQMGYGDISG